ncbi:MAG: hypothetical protein NZT92_10820 [Abditibacteriales bacterium]|nr:hypothetical protein [Abditibacteriales bacterium]MDW8366390.1 hypothetical protein [Abditibacteriales bacterium]
MWRILRVITLTVTFSIMLWLLSAQRVEGRSHTRAASAQSQADAQLFTNSLRSSAAAPTLSSG